MTGTNRQGLWTAGFGEIGATLKALEDHNITVNHLARLRADSEYAKRVAEFIIRGGLSGEIKYKDAKSILSYNFFGPEEWLADYGFNLSQEEFNRINNFPWSEDVLNSPCPFVKDKTIKETHFAFLGLEKANGKPLTLMKWHEMYQRPHLPRFYNELGPDEWKEDFATKETCQFRWYLMPLVIIPGSLDKKYNEQLELVPSNYEVATAIEEITKNILFQRKTTIFLNADGNHSFYNRSKSVYKAKGGTEHPHVYVGWFNLTWQLEVNLCWDTHYPQIGIALSMKP